MMAEPATLPLAEEPLSDLQARGVFGRIRCWPAVVILLAGAAVAVAVLRGALAFTSRPTIDLLWTFGATDAALFVWLMLFSRMRPVERVKSLFAWVLLIVVAGLIVRVDGFQGDGRPMLAWRWSDAISPRPVSPAIGESPSLTLAASQPLDLTKVSPGDSSQFRGPERSGIYHGPRLARDWSRSRPRELWRLPLEGGWSSFATAGEFGVTQEQRGQDEAVVCRELRTGRERWVHLDAGHFQEMMGGDGPRATPTIKNGRVYALGATGILNCLEGATGRRIWSRDVLRDAGTRNALFGMAGSPLVESGMVVVSPGGAGRSLIAYRVETGEILWGAGTSPAAYSAPVLTSLAGRSQILIFNADGLYGHDPGNGRVLWSYPWVTPPEMNNVCQPISLPGEKGREPNCVFLASGYNKGCAVLEIQREQNRFHAQPVWTNRNLRPKFSSAVLRDGFVFGLDDRHLTCLDVRTGERRWRGGRYGYGQLILSGDLLIVQAETGEVVLVAATPEGHQELASFPVFSRRTWTVPTLAGRLLLVRNDREAACLELPLAEFEASR